MRVPALFAASLGALALVGTFGASAGALSGVSSAGARALGPAARAREDALSADELAQLERAVVRDYAVHVHELYARCAEGARTVRSEIERFLARPTAEALADARRAWLAARDVYGLSEALRFYGGPIDDARTGVETLLNAWPIDEAYVDGVAGRPDSGIIQDPVAFPHLDQTLLVLLNERGGEANVCIGWHAIEFLLWGQDLHEDGPGRRQHTDYVAGVGAHAERRALYLRLCADLLVQHLESLEAAWAPGVPNYRAAFETAPTRDSLRKVLAGVAILSGFEMAGERLAVAFETRDQEDEHSCFSDNTRADFVANQLGILAVWGGAGPRADAQRIGLRALAQARAGALAATLDAQLAASLAALRAIPEPFDRAVRAPDGEPAREAVHAALLALERQSETLATLALSLGFEIALQPGG